MADQTSSARTHRRPSSQRGQALVEFALVSLAFFTVVFGIFDGARLFQSWVSVQHASREGARYAITGRDDCDGITDDRPACIAQTASEATTGLSDGGLGGSEVSVTFKKWDYPAYAGSGTAGDPGDPCDAVEVAVSYTHQFVFPVFQALAPSGVNLTGRQRMVNEPFGPCS